MLVQLLCQSAVAAACSQFQETSVLVHPLVSTDAHASLENPKQPIQAGHLQQPQQPAVLPEEYSPGPCKVDVGRPVHRVSTSSNKLRLIKTNTGSKTVVQFCDLDITDSLLINRCVIVGPDCDRGNSSSRSDASISSTGTVSARLDRELSPSRRVLSPQSLISMDYSTLINVLNWNNLHLRCAGARAPTLWYHR